MTIRAHYENRRVLVTGHTGFKGSWLVQWLVQLGAKVAGFALEPDTEPSLFELARVGEGIRHTVGDVRDSIAIRELFAEFEPDVVFHLAAQPLVRRSYREPKETFDTNVGGTINVLEAIRSTPSVQAAVIVTTDKVYENREWLWGYRENDALGGHDPYSASKAAAELVVGAYRRSFFAPGAGDRTVGLASARAGNVIGGGDWAEDRILPDALRALAAERALEVRSPASVRPWQHVLESLSGYLALGARLLDDPAAYSSAWNIGPARGSVETVAALIDSFLGQLGRGEWVDVSDASKGEPHEAGLLWLCCDKANSRLDWFPVFDTEQAIAATATWYRKALFEGGDARELCLQDIADYVTAAVGSGAWWSR